MLSWKSALTDRSSSTFGLFAAALVVSGVGFYIESGLFGVVIAVCGVLVGVAVGGVYGIAVHHFGAIAVLDVPSAFTHSTLALAGSFLLVAGLPSGSRLVTWSLTVLVATTVLGAGTLLLGATDSTWLIIATLVAGVGTAVYLAHRYARIQLGLAAQEGE